MASRTRDKTTDRRSAPRDSRQSLEARVAAIEQALHDAATRAGAGTTLASQREQARQRAIAEFDYQERLARQPEVVRKMREEYARLNAFLAERGFEPVENEYTR